MLVAVNGRMDSRKEGLAREVVGARFSKSAPTVFRLAGKAQLSDQ
jgi:hypothetical protein